MKNKATQNELAYKGLFVNITLHEETINGKVFTREIVESKEGVLIAALTPDNKIILIKQHRYNHGEIFEVPAGAIKRSETALKAAKRELLEETGIKANKWQEISQHSQSVHSKGLNFIFIARDLEYTESLSLDKDESISLFKAFTFKEVSSLIAANKIPDLRNRSCIWLTELTLLKNEKN
ncbi:MAG: NUDIX hydrolase [Patescibacteria group bacterium]